MSVFTKDMIDKCVAEDWQEIQTDVYYLVHQSKTKAIGYQNGILQIFKAYKDSHTKVYIAIGEFKTFGELRLAIAEYIKE